jgi:rhodanese-related sulfurtransferase
LVSVDALLAEARAGLQRVGPHDAARLHEEGALLVDTRPVAQRAADGEIPGALLVERNVLEWRLDPTSRYRLREMASHARRVVVLCTEGYASSLAAATLRDLGLDATDVDGGFVAWKAAGLPVTSARRGTTG